MVESPAPPPKRAWDSRQRICAHRGGALLWPENSLLAFRNALALPIEEVECDVHLSADGVVMVHHDATLDRTTEGTGPLAHRTAAELATTRLRGLDEGVPTLESLLHIVEQAGKVLRLELKEDHQRRFDPHLLTAVSELLARSDASVRLMSFVPAYLAPMVTLIQDLLIRPADLRWYDDWSLDVVADGLSCEGLGLGYDLAELRRVFPGMVRDLNIWGANTEEQLREALALNPHSITTDDPVTALTLRSGRATSVG